MHTSGDNDTKVQEAREMCDTGDDVLVFGVVLFFGS